MTAQRKCWVTGASSGIGRELCLQLAARGDIVYASARSQAALEQLAAAHPQHIVPLPLDVSDDAAMTTPFDQLPAALRPDRLDLVIAAAGACEYVDLPQLDPLLFRRVADVNYFGTLNTCRAALPLLQAAAAAGGARPELVGICSMSVYTGFPRAEAYGASKAAQRYLLEALRCDVGEAIDVCIVYPGFVATPMTAANDFPMPFCISADHAARVIVATLGRRRRTLAFPWQLHLLLRLAAWLPGLWYGVLVPRLSRAQRTLPASGGADRSRHTP